MILIEKIRKAHKTYRRAARRSLKNNNEINYYCDYNKQVAVKNYVRSIIPGNFSVDYKETTPFRIVLKYKNATIYIQMLEYNRNNLEFKEIPCLKNPIICTDSTELETQILEEYQQFLTEKTEMHYSVRRLGMPSWYNTNNFKKAIKERAWVLGFLVDGFVIVNNYENKIETNYKGE